MCFGWSKEPSHRDVSLSTHNNVLVEKQQKNFSYTPLSGGLLNSYTLAECYHCLLVSLRFLTWRDSTQSPQLQRLTRIVKLACCKFLYGPFRKVKNRGADQSAQMCRLVFAYVRKPLKTIFLTSLWARLYNLRFLAESILSFRILRWSIFLVKKIPS